MVRNCNFSVVEEVWVIWWEHGPLGLSEQDFLFVGTVKPVGIPILQIRTLSLRGNDWPKTSWPVRGRAGLARDVISEPHCPPSHSYS